MTKTRPFLVTLVCLYLLITGTYGLVKSFEYLNNPDNQAAMEQIALPYDLQVAVMYINLTTMVVTGMFMMQEKNWARWVYLGWGLVYVGYRFCFLPASADIKHNMNLIGAVIYVAAAIVLLLPNAGRYFTLKGEFD